jgi:Bacterial PH domain
MATINQEFQSAPMGRRVMFTVALAFGAVLALVVVNATVVAGKLMNGRTPSDRLVVSLAPLAGLLITWPVFLYERSKISRFAIAENVLVLGSKRYPLEGMASAERDPEVMCRAVRVFGNGGLGSIRGRFWSKRLGKFYAFLSGTENAVVLRWPDRVVAVSPADPEFFITCAKSAAGIR